MVTMATYLATHSPQVVQHSPAGMPATEQLTSGHVAFCIHDIVIELAT